MPVLRLHRTAEACQAQLCVARLMVQRVVCAQHSHSDALTLKDAFRLTLAARPGSQQSYGVWPMRGGQSVLLSDLRTNTIELGLRI